MEESTTKEKILKDVRNALIAKRENPFKDVDFKSEIMQGFADVPEMEFAANLNASGGNFVYCENEMDFVSKMELFLSERQFDEVFSIDEKIVSLLDSAGLKVVSDNEKFNDQQVGVSRCDYLIARFGSVMVSSGLNSGRRIFVYPEIHVVFAYMSQIVNELKDALAGMKKKYVSSLPSQITVISGPSRTADIEKTLVMGAHGPKELIVFVVDDY